MKIKTGLITLILFLFIQTCPSLIFSAHAWIQHNSKEGICAQLDSKLSAQGLRYSINMPSSQNRFFLPPLPVSSSMLFNIEMVPNDRSALVALRYGTPTQDYPSDPEKVTFTHSNADYRNFTLLTDVQDRDVVTRYDSRWSSTINVLNFSNAASLTNAAGDYLYVNLFGNRGRILNIVFFIIINVPEAQKWCQQGSVPSAPQVTPASGTRWLSSPQEIEVRSTFAHQIYYLKTESNDPNTPAPDITSTPSAENSTGVLEGARGTISLEVPASAYRQFKFRFTASNDLGSTSSPVYTYTIDRQPVKIGNIRVAPASGTVEERSTLTLNVSSDNSSRIYYTQTESPGQDPGDPKGSSQYISGPNGTLTLSTTAGVEKTFRLKFVGHNDNNPEGEKFGEPSNTLTYTLKGTAKTPGAVSANPPSGTYTTRRSISVSSSDATTIHYTLTTDGKAPDDPKTALFTHSIPGNQGSLQLPGQDGRRLTVRMSFRGYNETSGEWGPLATFTYTVDLTGVTPTPTDKAACEAKGWVWVQLLPILPGVCKPPEENPNAGSISVEIHPREARTAGAQWKIAPEGVWKNSGDKVTGLTPGIYAIEFKPVPGWIKPNNIAVTVKAGDNSRQTGTYQQDEKTLSSLTVILMPQSARNTSLWSVKGSALPNSSGSTITLDAGDHEITLIPGEGWQQPESRMVSLGEGDKREMIVTLERRPHNYSPGNIPVAACPDWTDISDVFGSSEAINFSIPMLAIGDSLKTLRDLIEKQLAGIEGIEADFDFDSTARQFPINLIHEQVYLLFDIASVHCTSSSDGIITNEKGQFVINQDGVAITLRTAPMPQILQQLIDLNPTENTRDGSLLKLAPQPEIFYSQFGHLFQFYVIIPNNNLEDSGLYFNSAQCTLIVQNAEAGMQQVMLPYFHDFAALQNAAHDLGIQVRVEPDNAIVFTHWSGDPLYHKGLPDCRIRPSAENTPPPFGFAADANGDGLEDFYMTTSQGTQYIFTSPWFF